MVKLHGTDIDMDDDLLQSFRDSLINRKQIIKKDGEYFWTIKSRKDLIKALTRLKRSTTNPFWRFYYSFFKW